VLAEFGADAFRLYEMFMGPLEMVKPWNTNGVEGVYRFLGRVWRLFVDGQSEAAFEQAEAMGTPNAEGHESADLLGMIKLHAAVQDTQPDAAQLKVLHACIKKVTEDLEGLRFNTAISAMMIFANEAMSWKTRPVSVLREFLILLQPFAPHIAEELWQQLGARDPRRSDLALAYQPWPAHDPALLVEDSIEIPVQVNGKLREVIRVPADVSREMLQEHALNAERIKPLLEGKTVRKCVVVPGRLVNVVVA
jgi:leucyl-tRNA synthetase